MQGQENDKGQVRKLQDMLDTEFEETLDDLIEVERNEPILSEEVARFTRSSIPRVWTGASTTRTSCAFQR